MRLLDFVNDGDRKWRPLVFVAVMSALHAMVAAVAGALADGGAPALMTAQLQAWSMIEPFLAVAFSALLEAAAWS